MISDSELLGVMKKLDIPSDLFTEMKIGYEVELEHGLSAGRYNVTDDDPIKTACIAYVHILEFPQYYTYPKYGLKATEKYFDKIKLEKSPHDEQLPIKRELFKDSHWSIV